MDIRSETRSSLRESLHFLFKRRVQIVLFFLATVCAVTIWTLMTDPTYEAQSRILVKLGRENLYVPTLGTSGSPNPVVSVNQEAQLNSELEILRSRALAEEVVKALGSTAIYEDLSERKETHSSASILTGRGAPLSLTDEAVLRLQEDLTAEVAEKSNVIQITYKNKDPEKAALVVNTLVNRYLDRHLDVYKNPESYTFFQEQSQLLKGKLNTAEGALKGFKEKNNLSSLHEQRMLLLQEDSALRSTLNQTESAIIEMQKRLEQLHRQIASVPKTIPQGEETSEDPTLVSNLQAKLVELELREKELKTKYTDQSRLVVNVKDEISHVRQKLDQLVTKNYKRRSSGINTTYQRIEEGLLRDEAELKALTAKQKTILEQRDAYQVQLENLNRSEVELNQLVRAVELDRQNYHLYLNKFEESRISNAMDTQRISNVSLIEEAGPPLKPTSPKVMLNLLVGIIFGVFGGLGLAYTAEYLDDSIETPEQAEKLLALPVLASVPQLKN